MFLEAVRCVYNQDVLLMHFMFAEVAVSAMSEKIMLLKMVGRILDFCLPSSALVDNIYPL